MSTVQTIMVTADLERLSAFYVAVVGAVPTVRMPPEGPVFYQGFQVGDGELGLVADEQAPTDPGQRLLLSIEVPEVDALLDRVLEFGGTVLSPPSDMPWGQRVGHIKDPDGNAVNLTHTGSSPAAG